MKVVSLFVRYGKEKYVDADLRVKQVILERFPSISHKMIVIDNSLPNSFVDADNPDCIVIGGDNSQWEFSGWDCALRFLGKEVWAYDLVHLATSAFETLYTKYIDIFDRSMLEFAANRCVVLGHIDCYNEPVELLTFVSQSWIRTSFLFVRPVELMALDRVCSVSRLETFFSDAPDQPFLAEAPISDNYKKYILDWLVGGGTGQGVEWHSRFALNSETLPYFAQKALAIINEHLLINRLQALGCLPVDAIWLSGAYKKTKAQDVNVPSWRTQLAERPFDRLVLS